MPTKISFLKPMFIMRKAGGPTYADRSTNTRCLFLSFQLYRLSKVLTSPHFELAQNYFRIEKTQRMKHSKRHFDVHSSFFSRYFQYETCILLSLQYCNHRLLLSLIRGLLDCGPFFKQYMNGRMGRNHRPKWRWP
jgi:hypothetical protein